MIKKTPRKERVRRRHQRIRKVILGTTEKPRLCVYRSNRHFYAQIVDDIKACTVLACSTLDSSLKKELVKTWDIEAAKKVGESIARRALEKGIKRIVLDRGGSMYHGKVLAFSDAARKAGLEF